MMSKMQVESYLKLRKTNHRYTMTEYKSNIQATMQYIQSHIGIALLSAPEISNDSAKVSPHDFVRFVGPENFRRYMPEICNPHGKDEFNWNKFQKVIKAEQFQKSVSDLRTALKQVAAAETLNDKIIIKFKIIETLMNEYNETAALRLKKDILNSLSEDELWSFGGEVINMIENYR